MKPKNFRTANKIIGGPDAGQPEYRPLPIFTNGAVCASRWALTPEERYLISLGADLTIFMLTGETQPPISPQINLFDPLLEDLEDLS